MNPKEYAEKAVTINQLEFRSDVPLSEAGTVSIRYGYPEPRFGDVLFSGPRGRVNEGIDARADHLRKGIAELIANVAEDCIAVASSILSDEDHIRVTNAIRSHFDIRLN